MYYSSLYSVFLPHHLPLKAYDPLRIGTSPHARACTRTDIISIISLQPFHTDNHYSEISDLTT